MHHQTIGWGIIGTGHAQEFAKALAALPEARLVAVTSRSQERAEAFGAEYGAANCYHDVADSAQDPEVEVVYVGSAPRYHAAHAMECLRQGKHVLIEKPFTIDAAEAQAVVELARERNLFCMEALWSRFLPATRQMAAWLKAGEIGDVRQVMADFGFRAEWDPKNRHFDLQQRGGCLLDVGVYSLAFAAMALGETPLAVSGIAELCETGVDVQTAMILKYPGDRLALLSCANRTQTPHRACILGTAGKIECEGFVWAHGATLHRDGREPLVIEPKLPLPGYSYQASETMRCLREDLTESPLLPASEVLARMACMDEIRRQIGVVYPSS